MFILATYSIEQHKVLNVATLVGPSDSSTTPNIVFSTTKHHPVTFIESYSHSHRVDALLGSSPSALPLSTIEIPHPHHTPTPNLIPLERVSVSAAICQDIAYPSLLGSYIEPSQDGTGKKEHRKARSPRLIPNPSRVPTTSLALSQLDQVRARAVEQESWILRCDTSGSLVESSREGGISSLVAPDGEVRVLQRAGEGS